MIVACPGCETPHDSIYSAATHAWKKQDETHSEFSDLDRAIQATVDSNDLRIDADDVAPGEDGSQSDRQASTVDPTVDPGTDADRRSTDAGAQSLPSFDATTDGGATDDVVDDSHDPCPSCGDDGERVELLEDHPDVPAEVVARLREDGDRWCPECSTSSGAEVWQS